MDKKYTDKQISDYRRYERVRAGGRYNMFDPNARLSTGLEKEDYLFVMQNYSELQEAAEALDVSGQANKLDKAKGA